VIEPRIYRAAFVPALLAVVILMFSLEDRPPPLQQGLAADVLFDGRQALTTQRELVERHPDRRAGTAGDDAAAGTIGTLLAEQGFRTDIKRFSADGKRLANVVARRSGSSRRQVVIIAPRDADFVPDAGGSAADTAALVEIARVLKGRVTRKTLVLASVDGSTLGSLGTQRLLSELDAGFVDAVIVISNLAAEVKPSTRLLVATSNDSKRGGIGLRRSAERALRDEMGTAGEDDGAFGQLSRIAFPIGIGDQGVLLENGLDAIRLSGTGELPAPPSQRSQEDIDPNSYGESGRAVLRLVSSLDGGSAPEHGPGSYVIWVGKVLPGWALSLFALTLIFPALVASVDAFARARRRHEPVGRWWRWVVAGALPIAAALALAELLVLVGAAPDFPEAPLPPQREPLDGGDAVVLGALVATVALTWLFVRPWLIRRAGRLPDPSAPGAGCAAALVLSALMVAVWLVNPYAALMLVPVLHVWLLVCLAGDQARGPGALAAVLIALAPLAFVAIYYMGRLDIGPLDSLWYLFLLVTGHHVGLVSALLGCALLGVFASVLAILRARRRIEREPEPVVEEERPSVFGPGGYAGPGSLGGTESALPR
jgi:MFS family permease